MTISDQIINSIASKVKKKETAEKAETFSYPQSTVSTAEASEKIINSIAKRKKQTIPKLPLESTETPSFVSFLPEAVKETLGKTKDVAWEFAKAVLQAPQRAIASVVLQPAADVLSLATGKKIKPVYTPETKFEQAVLGKEPIVGIGERVVQSQQKIQKFLGDTSTAAGASLALAPFFIGGLTALDLTPVGGSAKNATKLIAQTTDKNIIAGLLRKMGATEDLVEPYAAKLAGITSEKEVEAGLKQLDNVLKTTKQTAKATAKPAVDIAIEAKPVIDVIKTTGKITKKTRPDLFAGNIRVDKISSEADVQQILKETAEQYKDKINEQTGGVITNKMTREKADMLGLDAEKMLKMKNKDPGEEAAILLAEENVLKTYSEKVIRPLRIAANNNPTVENQLKYNLAVEKHAALQAITSGTKSEPGRALQIQKVLAAEVPTSIEARNAMLKALGGQERTGEIIKRMTQIETLYEDSREAGIIALNKFIRDVTKVKKSDKVFEVFLNSILANPITQIVNAGSNTLRALYQVPIKYYQATLSPEVTFKEANHYALGLAMGLDEATKKLWFVLKNGLSPEESSKVEFRVPAIKGITGEVVRTPTKLLGAIDEMFKIISGTAELNAQAYRAAAKEGLKGKKLLKRFAELKADPTRGIMDAVKRRQLDVTFQQELDSVSKHLLVLRDKVPGARYIIPFIKTPLNLFKEAIALSPVGLVGMGKKLYRGTYKFKSPQQAEDLAKATLGSMLLVGIVYEWLKGNVTGKVPENVNERDAFYREGKQPYSFKIGDAYYSYRRIEPFSTTFGLLTDILDTMKESKEEPTEPIKQLVAIVGNNLVDRTYLSGLSNAINAINDPERYGGYFTSNLISGMVPFSGTFNWISRIQDQVIRNPKTVKEKIYSRLPFLQKKVLPKRNVWGEKIVREGGKLTQALSPITVTTERNDPIDIELKNLDYVVGFPGQTITVPKEISDGLGLDKDSRKIKLKPEEYDFLLNTSGYFIKTKLTEIFSSSKYQQLDEAEKNKVVDTVINNFREQTRMMVLDMIFKGGKF